MELLIRNAQPDDAEAIIGIFNPIIESGLYTMFDTPFTVEAERDYILNQPERSLFHVAARKADNRIVGFQSLEPLATNTHAFDHVATLGTYVDSAFRRQGVASRLFAATFETAQNLGYEKLFTFIRADNHISLATYLSQGFYIVGTAHRQVKIKNKYIDEVMVERFL